MGATPAAATATNDLPTLCRVVDAQTVAAISPADLEAAQLAKLGDQLAACKVLDLKKTVSNATPAVGDTIQWTVTVSNPSKVLDVPNVTVADVLPSLGADLLFSGAFPTKGTFSLGTGAWSVGTLKAGESEKLLVNEIVNGTTAHENCADATVVLPRLDFVPEVPAVPAVPAVPGPQGHPAIPGVPAVPAHLKLTEYLSKPIKLAHACATETPKVAATPTPTATPSGTPTPEPTPTPVLTSTSVGLPDTGRQA
jgi:uncharacterized repeat protein (TIGR01451 family)